MAAATQHTPSEIILRDYQERDLEAVRAAYRVGRRAVLLVEPTGAGKGTEASVIVQSATAKGRRTLFTVNRRALVHDMAGRLERLGIRFGVVMGTDPRRDDAQPVQVASIDTLRRRETLPPADLIVVDEAHGAVSPGYKAVLDRYPAARILGLTATPVRLDGRGLGEMFDFMVVGPSVAELISQGWLVPSRTFAGPKPVDLSGVDSTAGDFNQKQLAQVCDKKNLVGDIVTHWRRLASDRKTVSFGVNQAHAQHIAEQFRMSGVECAYVDAETPDDERDRVWRDLDFGRLPIVSSVGVISYGWDHPIVSCCILARPTESMQLHLQQIGRGCRPAPGKVDLRVLDHAGNTHRHGFYEDAHEWTLQGITVRAPAVGDLVISITTCRRCFGTFRACVEVCPYCGAPVQRKVRRITVEPGELEEMRRGAKEAAISNWRERVTDEEKRAKYREFREIAAARNYAKNWPMVRFKLVYGHWPNRSVMA